MNQLRIENNPKNEVKQKTVQNTELKCDFQ